MAMGSKLMVSMRDSYQGLVDYIKELGRMILGTARYDTFRKREGRLKVVENMIW